MATPKYNDPSKKKNMPATTRGVGKATPMPKVTKKGLPSGSNMSRMSADDKSRQALSFRSAAGYGKNVVKEWKDWRTAQGTSKDGKAMPEAGQFWGALLQGRRYK